MKHMGPLEQHVLDRKCTHSFTIKRAIERMGTAVKPESGKPDTIMPGIDVKPALRGKGHFRKVTVSLPIPVSRLLVEGW